MKQKRQISPRVFATTVVLALLLSVAFLQRILPLTGWNAFPQDYTVDGEAILTNVDGYYYLNAAKEILNGSYSTKETHRAIPNTIRRSAIPPLLSVLTATITKITGVSINWVGAMLPAILSLFIAAPVFFLGWHYGGAIAATTATAITLLAPAFLIRNNFGFYDTDCLNAFFPYTCAIFSLLFATGQKRFRRFFLLAAIVTALLFLWWWDQTIIVPLILGFAPLCMALLFFYPLSRSNIFFLAMAALLLCAGLVELVGLEAISTIPKNIIRLFLHLSKQSDSLYPPVSMSIGEQAAMNWKHFALQTFAFPAIFFLAISGVFLLAYRAKKEFFLFVPVALVAIFTFFFAIRFVIFAVPFFALGFGVLLGGIYQSIEKRGKSWLLWGYGLCVTILLSLICWSNFRNTPDLSPAFSAPNLAGMKLLHNLEENAVVWSWWDQGHPLVYWGERDTINDGMVHDNERTHCNAVPLVTSDDRFAANYINFYVSQGKRGRNTFWQLAEKNGLDQEEALQKLLTAGPGQAKNIYPQLADSSAEEMESLLFPEQKQPLYLFLDMRQTNNNWIHFFGSWKNRDKHGQRLLPYINILMSKKDKKLLLQGDMPAGKNFHLDRKEKLLLSLPSLTEQPIPLAELKITTAEATVTTLPKEDVDKRDFLFRKGTIAPQKRKFFTSTGRYVLDVHLPTEIMLLRDKNMAESVSNRLFWRHNEYNPDYFSPVVLKQPYYQIWRVKSDMDSSQKQ